MVNPAAAWPRRPRLRPGWPGVASAWRWRKHRLANSGSRMGPAQLSGAHQATQQRHHRRVIQQEPTAVWARGHDVSAVESARLTSSPAVSALAVRAPAGRVFAPVPLDHSAQRRHLGRRQNRGQHSEASLRELVAVVALSLLHEVVARATRAVRSLLGLHAVPSVSPTQYTYNMHTLRIYYVGMRLHLSRSR